MKAAGLVGQKFADPRSWHDTVAAVRMAASVDKPEHKAERKALAQSLSIGCQGSRYRGGTSCRSMMTYGSTSCRMAHSHTRRSVIVRSSTRRWKAAR